MFRSRFWAAALPRLLWGAATAPSLAAADGTWPREVPSEMGVFTFYQPQPEAFVGNILTGRCALSLTKSSKEPTSGVMWFTCRVDTDREAGTAMLRNIVATKVRGGSRGGGGGGGRRR